MRKIFILLLAILFLNTSAFGFGSINAAAYRQSRLSKNAFYGKRQQKTIPYWQIQSNYATRTMYRNQLQQQRFLQQQNKIYYGY